MQKKNQMENQEQENKVADVIGTFLIIILIPILIVALTITIKANINHNKVPDFMGYKLLICASNSMQNVFELGDVTITKEVKESELEQGDIITFWNSKHDTVITHRIDKIEYDEENRKIYITKGDMNNTIDPEVITYEQIEGKYIGHIKYLGKLILTLQKPTGLIVAFLIPIIIISIIYRHDVNVKKKRKDKLLQKMEEKRRH